MRKQILLFALVLISSFVMAQESDPSPDHKIFVGGNVNFNTNTGGTTLQSIPPSFGIINTSVVGSRSTNFSISPYIGGRHNEHWDFGIGFGISIYKSSGSIIRGNEILFSDQTRSGLNFYAFGRYKLNPSNKVKFFLQPSIGAGLQSSSIEFEGTALTPDINYAQAYLSVGTGVLYDVNDRFRLLATLGNLTGILGKQKFENSGSSDNYNSIGLNFGTSSFRIGGEVNF